MNLPIEVVREGILPYLSVYDLQALDTAYTNKYLRPQFRQVWQSYPYASMDEINYEQLCWLRDVGADIVEVKLSQRGMNVEAVQVAETLSDFKRLKQLICDIHFPRNAFIRIVESCTGIEVLCLSSCEFSGAALAQHCSPLHTLIINSDEVTNEDITAIANNCSKLRTLCVRSGELTDAGIMAVAHHSHQLHTLHIGDARITDAGIQALCNNCAHLKQIGLMRCSALTDASLEAIALAYPCLESINIEGHAKMTDVGLLHVATHCHKLQSMTCKNNEITNLGLTALWAANPNLMDVNINNNFSVSDDDIIQLAQCCPLLQKLNLSRTSISDVAVIAVAEHCPQLRSLDISSCGSCISNASLIALGRYSHELRSVNISHLESVYDTGVAALARGCPLLQEFNAAYCELSPSGVESLALACRDLRKVCLSQNPAIDDYAVCVIAENCPYISEIYASHCCYFIYKFCFFDIAKYCRYLTVLDVRKANRFGRPGAIEPVIRSCRMLKVMLT